MGSSIFYFLLKYHSIESRSHKESLQCEVIKEQRKQTNLKKYGVDNPAKSQIVKDKVAATFMKNYGVSNIFKDEKFKKMLPDLMITKYGVKSLPNRYGNFTKWWASQTLEYRKLIGKRLGESTSNYWKGLSKEQQAAIIQKRTRLDSKFGKSKLEDRVSNILVANNVAHTRQKWIRNRSYDFLIDQTNIIIEVNGDYFHANPKMYKEDDLVFSYQKCKKTAKEIWEKDIVKKELAEKYNYRVYYIWESDMVDITDEELYAIVSSIIVNHYEDKINKKDR